MRPLTRRLLALSAAVATTATLTACPAANATTRPVPTEHQLANGVVLPDLHRTPGATNPAVTQATIAATICRTGYTATIRPSSSYTSALKRRQLHSGYAWHGDVAAAHYEEDHDIPLELGGAPAAVTNLWPEPNDHVVRGAVRNSKDLLENQLHDLVCSHRLPLASAQQAIATNWWAAYLRYGGKTRPTVWAGRY